MTARRSTAAGRDPKTGRFPKGNGPGQGPGWGGPAKGGSASRIRPGDPDGIQAMGNDPDTKARAAARREKVLAMYEGFVDDTTAHPMVRIQAGDKLLDRIEGKPTQRQDVTSQGERVAGYVIAAPEEDESPEAWQARQAPAPR